MVVLAGKELQTESWEWGGVERLVHIGFAAGIIGSSTVAPRLLAPFSSLWRAKSPLWRMGLRIVQWPCHSGFCPATITQWKGGSST